MPFDAADFIENPLTFSPGRDGLRKLAHVLRHRELWPAGFEWNWFRCAQCGMGLASAIWLGRPATDTEFERQMQQAFGLSRDEVFAIFYGDDGYGEDSDPRMPTPEHVADAIDLYLAGARD